MSWTPLRPVPGLQPFPEDADPDRKIHLISISWSSLVLVLNLWLFPCLVDCACTPYLLMLHGDSAMNQSWLLPADPEVLRLLCDSHQCSCAAVPPPWLVLR